MVRTDRLPPPHSCKACLAAAPNFSVGIACTSRSVGSTPAYIGNTMGASATAYRWHFWCHVAHDLHCACAGAIADRDEIEACRWSIQ